ncbi:uncharacterized protein LOC128129226 [Lactuca sativa]|uniref:uncharacterized protein LOC128129226 n=1 Tax=Lactuca sativa TaxID=4236 RepID=UPI0022AFABB8|nr:uncharacterized protein LOC128129226 [Lactuca sativa]
MTAYELLKGRKPDISYFHVFGCMFYILNQKDQRSKVEAKVNKVFFLGYSIESKAFRVFNHPRQVIKESIHVTFEDVSFIQDRTNHHANILNEHVHSPSNSLSETIVPNIDHDLNHLYSAEDPIDAKDQSHNAGDSKHEVILNHKEPLSNDESINNNDLNHIFHHDHLESQTM